MCGEFVRICYELFVSHYVVVCLGIFDPKEDMVEPKKDGLPASVAAPGRKRKDGKGKDGKGKDGKRQSQSSKEKEKGKRKGTVNKKKAKGAGKGIKNDKKVLQKKTKKGQAAKTKANVKEHVLICFAFFEWDS